MNIKGGHWYTKAMLISCLLVCGGLTAQSHGQLPDVEKTSPSVSNHLKHFLQRYLITPHADDHATRVSFVQFKGKGSPAEIAVYVTGPGWCGTGGCTLLVVEPDEGGFRVIGKMPIVQVPIRVLSSRTNGLPDISVRVQGGGTIDGYSALIVYNGHEYCCNPSLFTASRLIGNEPSVTLIEENEGSIPLYTTR